MTDVLREHRLRRAAQRQHLRLVRFPEQGPAPDGHRYVLVDEHAGGDRRSRPLSLDEVQRRLIAGQVDGRIPRPRPR